MRKDMEFTKKLEETFGSYEKNSLPLLQEKLAVLDQELQDVYDFEHPFFQGDYNLDFYQYLSEKEMGYAGMDTRSCMKDMAALFQNVPYWKNPGTMINIIPPVVLNALACAAMSNLYNSNFAQDTYAGYLIAAELEVIKYISDLVNWDWKKSGGIFTFGGKGTNLYASEIALNKSDRECLSKGCRGKEFFMVTPKTGHPCHVQAGSWIGIGSDNVLEVECEVDGTISLPRLEQVIRSNIEAGKIFIGVNLNGGNTNELVIDPIKKVYDLVHRIAKDYELDYMPHIHVDSVIGWIYLFYNDYDFEQNPLEVDPAYLTKMKSIAKQASQFVYADSLGIDFHKTGFCPYASSLFLLKKKADFSYISKKAIPETEGMVYGDYDPYDYTLELSRSSTGPVAALAALKTLGKEGFQKILKNWLGSTCYFKEQLKKARNVVLLNEAAQGFAVLFILVPSKYQIENLADIQKLSKEEVAEIKKYNVDFSSYLLMRCLKKESSFYFTSSRSYVIPGTDISIGALKAYPTSIYFDEEQIDRIMEEMETCMEAYGNRDAAEGLLKPIADNMVYKKEGEV